jgi:diguanylate cyclase (GGDEF)-like protein
MKPTPFPISPEQDEIRGLARTVSEIEWLLLVLVLLYQAFGGPKEVDRAAVAAAMVLFAAFVLVFRYTSFYHTDSLWKIAIETWVMIVFITWSVWFSGKLESPLLNCYLLVIITSSLTLGKLSTAAELGIIAIALVLLDTESTSGDLMLLENIGGLAVLFAPFILVAYVTTMFSADIRYGLSRAKTLADTDELTGMLNRRAFTNAATRMFGHAVRYDRPLSMLMVDSDGLKKVNDSYGHGAGDELLRLLARCIQHELRTTDVSARLGGDEFAALLPETSAASARDVAERLRRAVENSSFSTGDEVIKTTVSVGVATFPDDARVLETLLANADIALYGAKMSGRNRVVEFRSAEEAKT